MTNDEYIQEIRGNVRRVRRGLNLIIQKKNSDGIWADVWSTNEMSDDYAYVNMRNMMDCYVSQEERGK